MKTNNMSHARLGLIAACAIAVPVTAILMLGLFSLIDQAAGLETAVPISPAYLPSISDLMIGTIQPRHERLWRAGEEGNWDFALYELGNLRGAFGRLGRAHPIETTHPCLT